MEHKTIINNIKIFRKNRLICEGIGEGDIRKYMENHQFVYIFYAGDGHNPRGWRTIRPYVLGTTQANNLAIRAWQDRGRSADYMNRPTRQDSEYHDYWIDSLDNKEKPGWRLFRLDKIEQIYPTGQRFVDNKGNVIIPPKYNKAGDKGMTSIIFQVSTNKEPEIDVNLDPESTNLQIIQKKGKRDWGVFQNANANRRKITPQEISNFKNIANKIIRKKAGDLMIVINNKNDFELVELKNINKVPQDAIVGNLARLYDMEVRQNQDSKADVFHNNQRKFALNEYNNYICNSKSTILTH